MFKLSKNTQSNFPGKKNVTYMQTYVCIVTYILVGYSLGAQRNVLLKRIWMAGRESESPEPDMLEFSYRFWIFFKSSITNTSRSTIKKSKTVKGNA